MEALAVVEAQRRISPSPANVISNDFGVSAVTVALSGADSATAYTDPNGNYVFTGLANGSYTVTPSKAGWTFTPASSPQTVSGADIPGADFIGNDPCFGACCGCWDY